jgi:uncharacterized protein YlaI
MKKDVVEHYQKITVFSLKKEGYFEGMTGEDRLALIDGQTIPLRSTRPNFGGVRFWFLCPDCGKRVAVLTSSGITCAEIAIISPTP